jgi:spore germination protein (amino acid permease)
MHSKLWLTKTQIFFLIVQTQLGFGMLNLPNTLQDSSKNDGWLSILIAGLSIQCLLVLYWLLLRRFPTHSYFEITKFIFGKYIGSLCNMATYIYLLGTATFILLSSAKLIRDILLNLTPFWVLGTLILFMCLYLCTSDIQIIARVFVILSILIVFLIILSFFTFRLPMDIDNIIPIGGHGLNNIIVGAKDSLISLYGFEIVLFLYPLAAEKKTSFLKNISFINLFVVGVTVYFTILSFLVFNNQLISRIKVPVVYMFRPLQFLTLDRIDLIFFSFWAIPMVLSISVYIYFASTLMKSDNKRRTLPILWNGLFVYLLFLFADKSDVMLDRYSNLLKLLSYLTIFFIPLTLLITSFLLRIKKGEEAI